MTHTIETSITTTTTQLYSKYSSFEHRCPFAVSNDCIENQVVMHYTVLSHFVSI